MQQTGSEEIIFLKCLGLEFNINGSEFNIHIHIYNKEAGVLRGVGDQRTPDFLFFNNLFYFIQNIKIQTPKEKYWKETDQN